MKAQASTSSFFTTRELRRYRSIFQTRNLIKPRVNTATLSKINKDTKQVNALFFVSSGAISPNSRAIIRKQFSQSNFSIKFPLYPTALSQKFAAPSFLKSVRSLLKGSSFQRIVTFKIPSEMQNEVEISQYLKDERSNFVENFNSINIAADGLRISFRTTTVFFPTGIGSIVPMRFSNVANFLQKRNSFADIYLNQVSIFQSQSFNIYQIINKMAKSTNIKSAHLYNNYHKNKSFLCFG